MTEEQKLCTDTMVLRAAGVPATDIDGRLVMMSLENGEYYALNLVGSRIWELIEKPRTIGDLVDALQAEYEVERAQCQRSISLFLEEMIEKGIVAVV
jgi:hypothetical protein